MAGVLKRTGNSVTVQINASDLHYEYEIWQEFIVGGSVMFEWKVSRAVKTSTLINYLIKFSTRFWSDKVNYIVTYTHWEDIDEMGSAVMRVRSDHFGAVYCPSYLSGNIKDVTVEISTVQSSPCAVIYDDADMTDFMLRGEDGSVPFHKVVLAAHSSVFKTMLAGEWKDTSEGVMVIPGMSKEVLQHLKKYMYLGKLPGKQNEQVGCLKQLLLLSSFYLMDKLKLRCIKELRFLLTTENVFDMIQFAVKNKDKLLLFEIMDCVAMGDVDLSEVRKLVKAEEKTKLQFE